MTKTSANISLLFVASLALAYADAEETYTIQNPLGLSWPWDLTHVDLDPEKAKGIEVVSWGNERRPVQIESVKVKGKDLSRLWFIATVLGEEKFDKKRKRKTRGKPPASMTIKFATGKAESSLKLTKSNEWILIENGIYEFRLRSFSGDFEKPLPLSDIPHWVGGMRPKGSKTWDGRAWFDGNAQVKGARTEILTRGPVFIDIKVVYDFLTRTDGQCDALPLASGKHTHTWKPNEIPLARTPKREHAYEVLLRFVAGDPWIDVNERYRLPRDPSIKPHGAHRYCIHWGEPPDGSPYDRSSIPMNQFMPVDTVTWEPWFEYDRFGGNINQLYLPARPRAAQKGRAFARLQPRWTQSGGGAQDFFLTSGMTPTRDRKTGKVTTPENYDPENPAVGIVAAFASKWVGPYTAIISAHALDGTRGQCDFPLIDGGRSGKHYGQRAYGLCVGPRRLFHGIDSLVRRHSDWTLVAQMNKYILEWKRDPAKAGPNAWVTRGRLQRLQDEWKSGKDTPTNRIIKEHQAVIGGMSTQRKQLANHLSAAEKTLKAKDADAKTKGKAKQEQKRLKKALRSLDKKMGGTDAAILRLITRGEGSPSKLPGAGLWLGRRYQDDFFNPTQNMTRRLPAFATADLFAGGRPLGGASQAALGYIHSDLDQWPGWTHGWSPGNPNFHTDKYMGAVYVATAMRDHPHADEWLTYGHKNFLEDMRTVLFEPDGVGYECPGYSGYSMSLQLKIARILSNAGFGNLVAKNPLFRKTGIWHRKLLTPVDPRIGRRHEAPHGDTHRWDSGMGSAFGRLAAFYTESDPAFARQMMGAYRMVTRGGSKHGKTGLKDLVLDMDPSIQPMPPEKMDWSSQAFYGFGVIMRSGFGTDRETFLSLKAGPAHGHYHNDENAYHFHSCGTPISLDYNCSYSPRGDHAALHNSMTFGKTGTVRHNARGHACEALEQIFGSAYVGAFRSTKVADLVVSERGSNRLTLSPVEPLDKEFSRRYPSRKVAPIVHRRFLILVKHPPESRLADYLVVRDETQSQEPQQVNIHLLARELKVDGRRIDAVGQWDKDMLVQVTHAEDQKVQTREWYYTDKYGVGPTEALDPTHDYVIKEGESIAQWDARMKTMMAKHGVKQLPLPGWKPSWKNPTAGAVWQERIKKTKGRALMPPPYWKAQWLHGECQLWIRLNTKPGSPVMWVLYPYERGAERPSIEPLAEGRGVRVKLGEELEDIHAATKWPDGDKLPGQAWAVRGGKVTVLVPSGSLPALGQIRKGPLTKKP